MANHIGIDARLGHYRVGGISTYTRELVKALESLHPDERFTVFHNRRARKFITEDFEAAKLTTPPHNRRERTLLSVELLRFGLDLLHSPDFIPPRRGAKKHVITVHDLTFLHYPQYKDQEARRYYNDQIEMAVKKADHILVVSEATKNDLIEMLNVPAEKMTVQPHGVEERFRPLSPKSLRTFGHEPEWRLPERGYILHVGTLEPRKNIDTLLDAYEHLQDAFPSVPPLLLVGKPGWMFDDTDKRIEQLQAQGLEIQVRSDISNDLLPIVYNLAQVVVMPSHYEGFGLPVLEAMACGIPVVASNVSSLPEVAGDAAALVNPQKPDELAQALVRALGDSDWRQQAIEAGMRRAAQFTWKRSAEIALGVYRDTLNG